MKRSLAVLFWILYIAFSSFLIVHSCLSAESSSEKSSFVGEIVDKVLSALIPDPSGANLPLSERWDGFSTFIRKGIGHFGGFFVCGALGFFAFFFTASLEKTPLSLACGGFLALFTEFLQLFAEGRGAQLSDSLLDFAGYFLSTALLYLLFFLLGLRKRKV
ncbi:MAG: VanZ family protein [Clostridia bacterium]|nr:VanZ family protein [Clostridia bacterium]